MPEARQLYERAVRIHESLTKRQPANREYRVELAKFYNNLAYLLREQDNADLAAQDNGHAIELIDELARPAPSLGIERADAHNLRGRILEDRSFPEALQEYQRSIDLFRALADDETAWHLPEYHLRFGDLLVNLSSLRRARPDAEEVRLLLEQAMNSYQAMAERILTYGSAAEARYALDTFAQVLPGLSDHDRSSIAAAYPPLELRLRQRAENRQTGPVPR